MPDEVATGRAGRFGLGQAVAVELVVMAVAIAFYLLPLADAYLIAAAAILPLLIVVGRFGGRWWYEVLGGWLQLHSRRSARSRAALVARPSGPYWAELATLAPQLEVRSVVDRNVPVGVGTDELGWFGAIAMTPHDALTHGGGAALRLDWLARLAGEPAAPVSAVQVVVRHTPLPSAALDPRSACAKSYQELRDALSVPPHRDIWIAVRLGLRDAATAAADYGGDVAGIHRALAAALSRVSTNLTSHGLAHRVLDGNELQQALVAVYGPDPFEGGPAHVPVTAHETWSSWRAVHAVHVCFAIAGWPAPPNGFAGGQAAGVLASQAGGLPGEGGLPGGLPDPLAHLARVPGALSVCTAVVLGAIRRPGYDEGPVGARTLIRVVAPPATVDVCLTELRARARGLGVKLVRLDGEQAAGVYATTPTAAPYGWGRL